MGQGNNPPVSIARILFWSPAGMANPSSQILQSIHTYLPPWKLWPILTSFNLEQDCHPSHFHQLFHSMNFGTKRHQNSVQQHEKQFFPHPRVVSVGIRSTFSVRLLTSGSANTMGPPWGSLEHHWGQKRRLGRGYVSSKKVTPQMSCSWRLFAFCLFISSFEWKCSCSHSTKTVML